MGLWKAKQWRVVKRLPGDADAWFAIGTAALEAGRQDEAIYALVHSAELAPDDGERARLSAEQLVRIEAVGEAERICRRALALPSLALETRAGLIRVLLDGGRDRIAREALDAALATDPNDPELRSLAAAACERLGDLAAAVEHLEAVLAIEPDHPELNRRMAGLLGQTGERGRSITCWRRVTAQTGPDDVEGLMALGIELSRDGQHDEAMEVLDDLAGRWPALAAVHANRGLALLAAGRLEEAVESCRRAQLLDDHCAQAHCGLGLAYQKLGRLEEAARAFRATESLAPENPAGALNLAVVLDLLGEQEEARLALLRAAALAPEDQEIHDALARFLSSSAREEAPQAAPLDATIRGELRSFQLFDVLEFLRVQSKTGSLVLSSRHGAGIIRLSQGALTSASAPGTPRLGDELVAHRLLSRAQIDEALSRQRRQPDDSAEALGSILLQGKLLDRNHLAKIVFEQALTALEEMTSWTEGAFSFHPADPAAAAEAPPVSFSVQQVVLELMRARDEREHQRVGSTRH